MTVVPMVAAQLSRRPAPAAGRSRPRPSGRRRSVSAGGFLLGLVTYGWVVLPFVKGGPKQVRDVWRAKFLNRGPDGKPLP